MSQDHTRSENPNFSLPAVLDRFVRWTERHRPYVSTTEPPRRGERAIYQAGIGWEAGSQLTIAPLSRFALAFRKRWRWALALISLVVATPASADSACDGRDDNIARPIAATLQPNASFFNPAGRVEVTLRSSVNQLNGLTSEIDVRHVLGTKLLFHTTIKLDDYLDTVRVQRLPAKEGIGFAVQVSYGGSGYGEVCTFGFRFQNGVVFYRTIAAKGVDRTSRKTFPGVVTQWKSALNAPRR